MSGPSSQSPAQDRVALLADAFNGLQARVAALETGMAADIQGVVRSGRELQAELRAVQAELRAELRGVQQALAGLQATGGRQRFKVPAPRKFSEADGTRSLMPWLSSLRAYVEFCGANPSGAVLATYLDGAALNAFNSHQKSCAPGDVVHDLDSFERILKLLMNLGNSPEVARQKMKLLRQGEQHITVYNSTFAALASECPDRSAFDMIGDYVDGLHDSIRRDVKMVGCSTLAEAMQKAVAASGIISVSGALPVPAATSAQASGSSPMDMDLSMLQASLNALMKQGGNHSSREKGKGVICWNCDQVGHYSKDCPQPKRKAGN